jgi:Bacitracin resistance protein BacA
MPPRLGVAQAALLGALHGPAELLPVSSSAHVALVPQLAGWPYAELPGDVRKAFEVILHGGTLVGLVVLVPRPPLAFAVLSTLPACWRARSSAGWAGRVGSRSACWPGARRCWAPTRSAGASAPTPRRPTGAMRSSWASRRRSRSCRARRGWA